MPNIGFLSDPLTIPPVPDGRPLRDIIAHSSHDLRHVVAEYFGGNPWGGDELIPALDVAPCGRPTPIACHLLRIDAPATTREVYDLIRQNGLRPGNEWTAFLLVEQYQQLLYRQEMVMLGGDPVVSRGRRAYPVMGYGCDVEPWYCRDCFGRRDMMTVHCLGSQRIISPGDLWDESDTFLVVRRDPD